LLTRYEFVHFDFWTLVVVVFAVGFTLDRIFVFFVAVVVHDRKKNFSPKRAQLLYKLYYIYQIQFI